MVSVSDISKRAPGGRPFVSAEILLLAVAFGLAIGAVEVLVHFTLPRLFGITRLMGRDYVWQLPLADTIIFAAVAVLYCLVALVAPRLRSPRVVIASFGALAAFAALLPIERIHVVGQALLGIALGVAMARFLAPRSAFLPRVLRLAVPGSLLVLALLAVAMRLTGGLAERRELAALARAEPGRPNILLIVLDTVRAWNLSLYGYSRSTTPRLEEWARQGVVFERALAPAPWTTLSHAVMFTGRHPTELSVTWDRPLDGTYPTLAQVLQDAGYSTAGFVANYTQAGHPTGLASGFLRYVDYPTNLVSMLRRTALLRRLAGIDRVGQIVGRRRMIDARTGENVNREFLEWLPAGQDHPWFAFLNYYEAHAPYLPPVPFDTMYFARPDPVAVRYWDRLLRSYGTPPVPPEVMSVSLDAYDGAIRYLDQQVDQILRGLAERGALANTIVVVTSDHGELFGEHGVISHGNNLYLPVLYVPLMVIAPGRVPAGLRVRSLAGLRDIPATVLELAGVPNPGMPGRSLAQDWSEGRAGTATDPVLSVVDYNRRLPSWPPSPVLQGTMWSLVLDSLHYILNGNAREELYHLGKDSWEVRNLAGTAEYQAELERHRGALKAMPMPDR
jgi:arylsulfatase A-like enzyme